MKKRICTLLLALCLTLGLLPAAAQAAGDGSGTFDTVRWTLDADGGLTVSGTGDLPDSAFAGRTDIVTVTFTGQVARIGRHVRQQLARDAASPHGRVDAHLEDLHLPVDDPPAGVTRKRFPFISCPPHAVGAGEFVGHERFVPSV